MNDRIRVTVWNEFRHEKDNEVVRGIYPNGIHEAIADGLREAPEFDVRVATLDDPEQGLSEAALAETDVLVWWGHTAHNDVLDTNVDRIQKRVLEGMGFIPLHSGHHSKPFRRLMGTSCNLKWREAGERERLWVVDPGHPIAEGVGEFIQLEQTEMYGEYFDIPQPDALVFVSWFHGGEVFRSGCCFTRGQGKIFYFRPGHETYPIYYHPSIRLVIANAVRWAKSTSAPPVEYGNRTPLEPLA